MLHQKVPAVSKDLSSASQEALTVDQNNDHKQDSTMKEEEGTSEGNGEKQRETLEEEIRMRRYSPRMTLPVQRKEMEMERRLDDEAEEATRRVSPKFQGGGGGGGGKVAKNTKEEKMYLFDLA